MKPKKLPERFGDDWQSWPTFEDLQKENEGTKAHALRALLAPVPCYRCEDNSVRYEREPAEAAIAGEVDADDFEDSVAGDLRSGSAEKAGLLPVLLVLKELARNIADARKEKNETIKIMGEPLRVGIDLMKEANLLMAKRLTHYDQLWDGMIQTSERLSSHETERQILQTKAQQQTQMRESIFGVLKQQFPKMMQNFKLAREASAAVELLTSFEGPVIDSMLENDVFTARQKELISIMRAARARQEPQAEPEQEHGQNHGVS